MAGFATLWTGMPFARKSEIFGLHSIPANTTPVLLKNSFIAIFRLQGVFPPRMSAEKHKCGVNAARVKFKVIRQTEF